MKTFLFFLACVYFTQLASGQGRCPTGWTKWKDEKCFLLNSTFSNHEEARLTCNATGGMLANVKEVEQQTFLNNFLFNTSAVEIGVWIGGTRLIGPIGNETNFRWGDGTSIGYANWATGSPTPLVGKNCVAMQSRFSFFETEGTWKDVSCSSPNYFVCETVPTWTLFETQVALIETRKSLQNLLKKPPASNSTASFLQTPNDNLVPVGFVYTQLPGYPEPLTIWPNSNWVDASVKFGIETDKSMRVWVRES